MGPTNLNPVTPVYPSQFTSPWRMKDGTEVTIRPVRAEDEPLMVKFHETLSDRTVYLRYFASLSLSSRTAHERLARICVSDYEHEMVLVAEYAEYRDRQTGELHILGVGRFSKLRADREAEIAVVVSDPYQHRGLGTELLRRLIHIARERKLCRIVAEMLRDNLAMQVIFRNLGFRLHLSGDSASVQAVLDL